MKNRFAFPSCLGLAVALLGTLPPAYGELVTTLIAPKQSAQAGSAVLLELASLNTGETSQTLADRAELSATLTAHGRSWPVKLRRTSPDAAASVAAHGFVLQRYEISIPGDVSGPAILQVNSPGDASLKTTIEIAGPAEDTKSGENAVTPATPDTPASTPATLVADIDATVFGRTFAGRLNAHDPVFFLYGSGEQAAKFQISFKYRAAILSDNAAKRTLSTLQVGYTQRSLWDIDSSSSPFYDTSYMPEVFWEWYKLPKVGEPDKFSVLGLQTGARHESNGKDGLDSRSMNVAYVRGLFTLPSIAGWKMVIIPEVWDYYGGLGENTDIADYRGYGRLQAIIGRSNGPSLRVSANTGKDFDHLTYQLDFTVPLKWKLLDMSAFFHVQYFNGYGESFRDYALKSDAFRAGFSLTR